MAVEGVARPIRIVLRIDMQDDPAYFVPVGAICLGIEHAQIGDGVLFVVDR
jgi:hypothetical protein